MAGGDLAYGRQRGLPKTFMKKKYFIAGGAGFVGSHLTAAIALKSPQSQIVIYDNFSSGRLWHLESVKKNKRLKIIRGDVKDSRKLTAAMKGADVVYHFASNPDIARAMTEPDIDFWEGTFLTHQILEAMRKNGVPKILYASGSGVYGDTGLKRISENYSPMRPISTYGASKLAGEALIASYFGMFGIRGAALRFANVVGPHQTHGVGYDFVKKLTKNPRWLEILGDGHQSKPYIYVSDVVAALRLAENRINGFQSYNVATPDSITVRQIAAMVIKIMGLRNVRLAYQGGDRGWKGDVPVVRLDSQAIRRLGWKNQYSSRQAVLLAIESILEDARMKKFDWTRASR